MTRSRYRIYDNRVPYFLTRTIVGWLPGCLGVQKWLMPAENVSEARVSKGHQESLSRRPKDASLPIS